MFVQPSPALGVGQIVPGAVPERERHMATADVNDVVPGRQSDLPVLVIGPASTNRQAKRIVAKCKPMRAAHPSTPQARFGTLHPLGSPRLPVPPAVQPGLAAPAAPRAEGSSDAAVLRSVQA